MNQEQGNQDTATLLDRLQEVGLHTVTYGLGSALQAGIGFVLLPLYIRYFDAATYGVFALLTMAGALGGAVFSMGAPSAIARSYYDYPEGPERASAVGTSIVLVVVGFLLSCLIGISVAPLTSELLFSSRDYVPQLIGVIITAFFAQINSIFFVLLRFLRKSNLVVGINTAGMAVTLLLIWLLLKAGLGLWAPIIGLMGVQALQVVFLSHACRNKYAFKLSASEMLAQLRFGIPSAIVGLLYFLLDSVDRVFIGRLLSLESVGIYSVGYRIGMAIQIVLVQPFGQIWTPVRMEYKDQPGSRRLFSVALSYYLIAGVAFSIFLTAIAPEVFILMGASAEYSAAIPIVGVVLISHLAYGAVGVVDCGIIFERKVGFLVLGSLLALFINVVLNILLIPSLGIFGAAISTLITYATLTTVAGTFSQRYYYVEWEYGRLARLSLITAAFFGVMATPWASSWQIRGTSLFLAGASIWVFVVTTVERSHFIEVLRKVVLRARFGSFRSS